jgi:hypothetical protein
MIFFGGNSFDTDYGCGYYFTVLLAGETPPARRVILHVAASFGGGGNPELLFSR